MTQGRRASASAIGTSNAQPLLSVDDLHVHVPVRRGPLLRRRTVTLKAVDGVSFEVREGRRSASSANPAAARRRRRAILRWRRRPRAAFIGMAEPRRYRRPETRAYRSAVQAVFQDPYSSMNPRLRIGSFIAEPLLLNRASAARSGASAPRPRWCKSGCGRRRRQFPPRVQRWDAPAWRSRVRSHPSRG